MKKLAIVTGAAAVAAAMVFGPAPVSAGPGEHLSWGGALNSGDTACPVGDRVINVVRKIINGSDHGYGTNIHGSDAWAKVEYVQQIQVDHLGGSDYCATLKYQGSLETVEGDSPNGDGLIASGIVGTFQGGGTFTFSATLSPSLRTKGNLGTWNQDCDVTDPAGRDSCAWASTDGWITNFFSGWAGTKTWLWWGWVYHAGNNGSWVESADGISGDITGN